MEDVVWLLLAVAASYGCAIAVPLVCFRLKSRLSANAAAWCSWYGLACPAARLIRSQRYIKLRAAAASISTDVMFRVVDYFRRCRQTRHDFAASEYFRFLIPFPVLLVVFADRKRRLDLYCRAFGRRRPGCLLEPRVAQRASRSWGWQPEVRCFGRLFHSTMPRK